MDDFTVTERKLIDALKAVLSRYPRNATPVDLRVMYGPEIAEPVIRARGLIANLEQER
jgi:hypothetical protein